MATAYPPRVECIDNSPFPARRCEWEYIPNKEAMVSAAMRDYLTPTKISKEKK